MGKKSEHFSLMISTLQKSRSHLEKCGQFLKLKRLEKGLSVDEIASLLEVSKKHYEQWEAGESAMPLREVCAFVMRLNLDPEEVSAIIHELA